MTGRDREREALARRAAAGDVEATRRLLALNEARAAGRGGDGPLREVKRPGTRTWEFWRRLDGAHKVFRDPESGRWAIADDSGDLPEQTDDGSIWIASGPIAVSPWRMGGQHTAVPALRDDDLPTRFSTSPSGMLWLASRLGVEIDTPDGRFRVARVGDSDQEDRRKFASISEPKGLCGCGREIDDPFHDLCTFCEEALDQGNPY